MAKSDNLQSVEHNRNEDAMRLLWAQIQKQADIAAQGGGIKRIEKEHAKGKLTARERLTELFDRDTKPLEIGGLAGEGQYVEHGGCPAGGVVVQMGRVHNRL
ncbi:MAG: acyl-CoA carboxylase subunit beta, partial [Bacteroidetes bacterium]|nr:acyl-CoA carboxylase subunit beta [Bacteroidota bacterium]